MIEDKLKCFGELFYMIKEWGIGFGFMVSYKIIEEY